MNCSRQHQHYIENFSIAKIEHSTLNNSISKKKIMEVSYFISAESDFLSDFIITHCNLTKSTNASRKLVQCSIHKALKFEWMNDKICVEAKSILSLTLIEAHRIVSKLNGKDNIKLHLCRNSLFLRKTFKWKLKSNTCLCYRFFEIAGNFLKLIQKR